MASVIIDIPGIGNVEAKNAATESTLKEIKNLLANQRRGGGGGSSSNNKGQKLAEKELGNLGKAGKTAGDVFNKMKGSSNKLVSGLGKVGGGLAKFGGAAGMAAQQALDLALAAGQFVSSLSKLEKNVSGAASSIPLIGPLFAMQTDAAEKLVNTFQTASSTGATFGGSVTEMSSAAASAGMTLDEFSGLLQKNGEAMRMLGGNTADGAKRFSDLGKEMRKSGMMTEMNALGYTSAQVNEGMASYIGQLKYNTRVEKMSNKDLAKGAKNYLKEMDMLSKITGKNRQELEAQREALAADGQFRAAMAGLGPEAEQSAMNMIQAMPTKELQDFAKDILANGVATTDSSQMMAAQMGGLYESLQGASKQIQSNQAVSASYTQSMLQNAAAESKTRLEGIKIAAAANSDLHGVAGAMGALQRLTNLNVDASKEEQEAATLLAQQNENMAAQMEQMRNRINEVSIGFTNMLATSGMMDSMMNGFELVASITEGVLYPVFSILGNLFGMVVDAVSIFTPAFKILGVIFNNTLVPVAKWLGDIFHDVAKGIQWLMGGWWFDGSLDKAGEAIGEAFDTVSEFASDLGDTIGEFVTPVFQTLGNVIDEYVMPPFRAIGNFFKSVFGPVIEKVSDAISWLADKFEFVANIFAGMESPLQFVKDMFSLIGIRIQEFALNIQEAWYAIRDFVPGLKDATAQERAALRAKREALSAEKEQIVGRFQDAAVRGKIIRKEEKDRQAIEDRVEAARRAAIERVEQFQKDAACMDFSDPLAVLGKEITNAGFVPTPEGSKSLKGIADEKLIQPELNRLATGDIKTTQMPDAAKADAVSELEKTKPSTANSDLADVAASLKNIFETDKSKLKGLVEGSSPVPGNTSTASDELNTLVKELLKAQQKQNDIAERQLRAQENTMGDLFLAP